MSLIPLLLRLSISLANLIFMEGTTSALRMYKIRLYSVTALRRVLLQSLLALVYSRAVNAFVLGDDVDRSKWDVQFTTPFFLAAFRILVYLYFERRHVEIPYRRQQGRELAWGYRTMLLPFAHDQYVALEHQSQLIPKPHRILLVPRSCKFDVNSLTSDGRITRALDKDLDFPAPPYKCYFKRPIKLPLYRVKRRDVEEGKEGIKDFHYFVFDFPRTLQSSLVDPQDDLDPFLLDHFREDFVSEVQSILKDENKSDVVEVLQYNDSKADLTEVLLDKMEELEAKRVVISG